MERPSSRFNNNPNFHMVSSIYKRGIREKLFQKQRGICWLCGEQMSLDPNKEPNPNFNKWDFNFLFNNEDTSWHLLTVSHSGTVSLVKGLSKGECEKMKDDLIEPPIKQGDLPLLSDNGFMIRAECFQ